MPFATPLVGDSQGTTGGNMGRSLRSDVRNYPTLTESMRTEQDLIQVMFAYNDNRRPEYCNAKFPTPRSNDAEKRGNVSDDIRNGLPGMVRNFYTPTKRDYKGKNSADHMNREGGKNHIGQLPNQIAYDCGEAVGQLNPDWVEWLMGWPIGWTDIVMDAIYWRGWECDPGNEDIPRTTERRDGRINRLKAIGNGQVPLCAAAMLIWGMIVLDGRK